MKGHRVGTGFLFLFLFVSFGVAAEQPAGQALYRENCASCHQFDGGGVPMMQPELIESERANGPKGGVIDMVLFGSSIIDPEMSEYSNEMPAFGFLSDEEIALIVSYVRTHFQNEGGAVTAADVRARRKP